MRLESGDMDRRHAGIGEKLLYVDQSIDIVDCTGSSRLT